MKISAKSIIKEIVPPFLMGLYYVMRRKISYAGPYESWSDAVKNSTGYGVEEILEKVKAATAKVRDGKAAYERDSVIFDRIEYPYPLLSGLLASALSSEGKLFVVDFGGSLGTTYFQNRKFLSDLKYLKWNVIEQPHFVRCGREEFETDTLKFFNSIDDCLKGSAGFKPTFLLSSVLHYIEDPYGFIEDITNRSGEFIIIDRTIFSEKYADSIYVQHVPKQIFNASYPCRFLSIKKVKDILDRSYELLSEFDGFENTPYDNGMDFKGLIYRRKGGI